MVLRILYTFFSKINIEGWKERLLITLIKFPRFSSCLSMSVTNEHLKRGRYMKFGAVYTSSLDR
jgi:hypothetical protein